MNLMFDIETNALALKDVTVIHCIVIEDYDTGERLLSAHGDDIPEAIGMLLAADCIMGHNIIDYDIPIIKKFFPYFHHDNALDTMIWAQLVVPKDELKEKDWARVRAGKLNPRYVGLYSLAAFGARLGGDQKVEHEDWETWSPAMQNRCETDVSLNTRVAQYLDKYKGRPEVALQCELKTKTILTRQRLHGILFDVPKAEQLHMTLLDHKNRLVTELKALMPPKYLRAGTEKASHVVPKIPARHKVPTSLSWSTAEGQKLKVGREGGAAYTKVKLTEFEPTRDKVATWLIKDYGWQPQEFGNDGKPTVDELTLKGLDYDVAPLLVEYFTVDKRLGSLANGKEAWLKAVDDEGRIHGSVNSLGATTRRMTHYAPNMTQVPAIVSRKTGEEQLYGRECRELFIVPKGYKMVGVDADALELRNLAARMEPFDGGAYMEAVLNGNKADGTDSHSINMRALGFDSRDRAKVWFYAFIYGAGAEKLGWIAGVRGVPKKDNRGNLVDFKARTRGSKDKARFLENLPALAALMQWVQDFMEQNEGKLKTVDGSWLPVRSKHSALNTLLQSDGAIIMKHAMVILDQDLQDAGFKHTDEAKLSRDCYDYEFVVNAHDEWQIEAREEIAQEVGDIAAASIAKAALALDYACPQVGYYARSSRDLST